MSGMLIASQRPSFPDLLKGEYIIVVSPYADIRWGRKHET